MGAAKRRDQRWKTERHSMADMTIRGKEEKLVVVVDMVVPP